MEHKINPNTNFSSSMELKVKPQNTAAQDLSGNYKIIADPDLRGKEENWQNSVQNAAVDAVVPGYLQETLGDIHGVVWYWKIFTVDNGVDPIATYRIQFGFVDYYAEFWLNGKYLGNHEGGDTQFEFDVSDMLLNGENLLSVRLINIANIEIDGFVFNDCAKNCKVAENILPAVLYNYGGINYKVTLVKTPKVYIKDVFVKPDWKTGVVDVEITTKNNFDQDFNGKISLRVGRGPQESFGNIIEGWFTLVKNTSMHKMSIRVPSHFLWSIEEPNLYTLFCNVEIDYNGEVIEHNSRTRFGFRFLEIRNGFFYLNGKRIYMKCVHTINQYPFGHTGGKDMDMIYQELYFSKASGFNSIRLINQSAFPEQLDLCDEIGLLIYEQCSAGWCLGESPRMKTIFETMTTDTIIRDRNHACVTIWGLLNEIPNGELYKVAREFLTKLREIDDTRIVLLGSGRWDCDILTGSVSNPYSDKWDYEWGGEAKESELVAGPTVAGFSPNMGDIHMYPSVPVPQIFIDLVRSLGNNQKPVFLSEFGVGSQFDIIRYLRFYEQDKTNPNTPEYAFMKKVADIFEDNWKKFGLEGVYPFASDMVIDSYRKQTNQRSYAFDMIRSNPNICGYSLTELPDEVYNGAGLMTYFREFKPGIVDVIKGGLAPLKWCMFLSSFNVYAGNTFTAEVVLANEDVLLSGNYPVCIRITGNGKVAWEKKLMLNLPEVKNGENPLAVSVLKEEISLDVEPGRYTFAAYMEKGGAPCGGRLEFNISDQKPSLGNTPVITWGISDETKLQFAKMGMDCKEFDGKTNGLIVVGPIENKTVEEWRALAILAANGSTVVFLSPSVFLKGDNSSRWLPLKNKGIVYPFNDWLFHKETIIGCHKYFDSFEKGIVDFDTYSSCYPQYIFTGQDLPDEVASPSFAVTSYCEKGYEVGMELCAYKFGSGKFVFNAFRILETLSDNPIANHLLHNIIKTEFEKLPLEYNEYADIEQMLTDINYIELPKTDV